MAGSSACATRQIWRSRRYAIHLASLEQRRALLDKRRRGLAMVLGLAAAGMAQRLGVHHLGEAGAFGQVHVLLHVTERDAWAARQRQRQRLSRGRAENRRREVELARLGRSDEVGEEIATAEIAGQRHLGEGGGEPHG